MSQTSHDKNNETALTPWQYSNDRTYHFQYCVNGENRSLHIPYDIFAKEVMFEQIRVLLDSLFFAGREK